MVSLPIPGSTLATSLHGLDNWDLASYRISEAITKKTQFEKAQLSRLK
jgi:hypothetical protein